MIETTSDIFIMAGVAQMIADRSLVLEANCCSICTYKADQTSVWCKGKPPPKTGGSRNESRQNERSKGFEAKISGSQIRGSRKELQ